MNDRQAASDYRNTVRGSMQKQVLMLAYFFPPLGGGGVQRTSKFVKYLPSLGWSPVVVTVREGAYWITDRSMEKELPQSVQILRTASFSVFGFLRFVPGGGKKSGQRSGGLFKFLRKASSFFLIPDQYVTWVPFALRAGWRYVRNHDVSVIYSTSSPDSCHVAALLLKRLCRKPWVADFRDPWTERLTFDPPTLVHSRLQAFLEKKVLDYADRVVCTSQEMVEDFVRKYPGLKRGKFAVITNGYDPDDFTERVPLEEKFTVSHTGILTGRRNCFAFLEGLRLFLDRRPEARRKVKVLFIGPRDTENEVRAKDLGLADVVSFLDTLPHGECVRAQLASHVLLLIEDEGPRGALIYPAKIFEYAASRRPILALVPEGAASAFVNRLHAGIVVPPSDTGEIAAAISQFFSAYESGIPMNGVEETATLAPFKRSQLSKMLAALLDDVSKG